MTWPSADETLTLDRLDRKIIHALQVDGRVPFRRVAAVLGVSEQTVARRYRRLRWQGALRVVGMVDPHRLGGTEWLVRIGCRPNAAHALAEAIARHPPATWVGLTSGGAEIVCTIRAPGLLERLPRTAQVRALNAFAVLHRFDTGRLYWSGYSDLLHEDQIAALSGGAESTPTDAAPRADDAELLTALAEDGRAGYAHLATLTGWPVARVTRRIAELRGSGALYFEVEFPPRLVGFETTAYLWLTVAPGEFDTTGLALAAHPETAWVAAITGPANLAAFVVCRTPQALYRYVNTRIGTLGAVRQVEVSLQHHQVKRAGAPIRT
ncbi:Lrp/AsnC family transcriptional regulator [Actinoallomurus sp. CA-150999]|uniref:Lrp/AsnC family transcriptional regulator n=1 Tax=Actinoallomurus sp. CA-150999 TaxID=3239887 RepID=UPI003D929A69